MPAYWAANNISYKISPVRGLTVDFRQGRLGQLSKIRQEQIHILCPSLRISNHLPAPILNGSASRLRAEPVMSLTKASLKLRNERSRSRCFAQSIHQRTALLSNISSRIQIPFGSSVLSRDWNVFSEIPLITYIVLESRASESPDFMALYKLVFKLTLTLTFVYILPPPETNYPLSWIFM